MFYPRGCAVPLRGIAAIATGLLLVRAEYIRPRPRARPRGHGELLKLLREQSWLPEWQWRKRVGGAPALVSIPTLTGCKYCRQHCSPPDLAAAAHWHTGAAVSGPAAKSLTVSAPCVTRSRNRKIIRPVAAAGHARHHRFFWVLSLRRKPKYILTSKREFYRISWKFIEFWGHITFI